MPAPTPKNLVLSRLSSSDVALLKPHLEPVDLPVRKVLEGRRQAIKAIYFPDRGFASVVADAGKPIEVGIIGREGSPRKPPHRPYPKPTQVASTDR